MDKKKGITGLAAGAAGITLLIIMAYQHPQLSRFLPSFTAGTSGEPAPTSPGVNYELAPQTVDQAVHPEDVHPMNRPLDLTLRSVVAWEEAPSQIRYTVEKRTVSKAPSPTDVIVEYPRGVATDSRGVLTSRHVYLTLAVTVANTASHGEDYVIGDNELRLLSGGIDNPNVSCLPYSVRCTDHTDCIEKVKGHLSLLPGEPHILEYVYLVPEFWLADGRAVFMPSHNGFNRYQLQMTGQRPQYIDLGLDRGGGPLAGLAVLENQTVLSSAETAADDDYTGLSYRLDRATLSNDKDPSLSPLEPTGEAPGSDEPLPEGSRYLLLDLTVTNPMDPLPASSTLGTTEPLASADTDVGGLGLYTAGSDGVLDRYYPVTASSAEGPGGTFSLGAGSDRTLRLAYVIPEQVLASENLYLCCVCPSLQGIGNHSEREMRADAEIPPTVKWIKIRPEDRVK